MNAHFWFCLFCFVAFVFSGAVAHEVGHHCHTNGFTQVCH